MLNRKGKVVLFIVLTGLTAALVLGFMLYQHGSRWLVSGNSSDKVSAQARVLQFLDRAGWKPKAEKVVVEKVGDDLGLARAVLLKKSNDGMSVPGVLFMVGRQYILVGRLFDAQTGKDLSPELFGKVPITFDLNRLNLHNAHKRGSEHPKVVIVEYGDYGCQSCAKLEKIWQPLWITSPKSSMSTSIFRSATAADISLRSPRPYLSMTNRSSGKFTKDSCQRTRAIGMKQKPGVLLKPNSNKLVSIRQRSKRR